MKLTEFLKVNSHPEKEQERFKSFLNKFGMTNVKNASNIEEIYEKIGEFKHGK